MLIRKYGRGKDAGKILSGDAEADPNEQEERRSAGSGDDMKLFGNADFEVVVLNVVAVE